MKTSALITYIQRRCPDWSRGDLRSLLNEVQNMVYGVRSNYMRVLDLITGKDPILTVRGGVNTYILDEVNFGYDIKFCDKVYTGDRPEEANITTIETFQGSESECARLVFSNVVVDGTQYNLLCYRKPQQITSENIQLEIPEQYHIHEVAMGVVGLCEKAEHGESNAFERFLSEYMPLIRQQIRVEANTAILYNKGKGY